MVFKPALNHKPAISANVVMYENPIVPVQVYYFIPVGFRGDLKQMGQAFNLTRKPGSEKVQRLHMARFWIKGFFHCLLGLGVFGFRHKTCRSCSRTLYRL